MSSRTLAAVHDTASTTPQLGLWIYLLSDLMIFGALFATYMILRHSTAGGPDGAALFEPGNVLLQTIALLASSFTVAMAQLALRYRRMKDFWQFVIATIGFGVIFLGLEIMEFVTLVREGHTWQQSAFLSSFFALVGTHGLHITVGLIWLFALVYYYRARGTSANFVRKFGLFTLFWHFLDIVWIWIFTIVYMFSIGGV